MKSETIIVATIGAIATIPSSLITKSCERQLLETVKLQGTVKASSGEDLSGLTVVLLRNDVPAEKTEVASQGDYALLVRSDLGSATKLAVFRGSNLVYAQIYDPHRADLVLPEKPRPPNSGGLTVQPNADTNPVSQLATMSPSKVILKAALDKCPKEGAPKPSLTGAKDLLECIGAEISLESEGYVSGILKSGYEVTIWTEAYEKKDRYSARFGMPLPGRPYFASNDTYIEVQK